ncbi:MAG: aminotransferase class IV [Caulobacteraceae bacterium]
MTPIEPTDRGFTLGDGLFETVLAEHGRLVLWAEHMRRLADGCAVLGLPAPDADRCAVAARDALATAGLEASRAAVRLTWTAGPGGRGLERPAEPHPELIVTAAPSALDPTPISLATVTLRRNPTSPTSRLKTLAYLDSVMARRQAHAAGAGEALMLDTGGRLACAAAANLFWIEGDRLFTPALDCGVLAGTVRAALVERFAPVETSVPRDALDRADAIFLTNSLIGVRPVAHLDGRDYPADHAMTKACAEAVAML